LTCREHGRCGNGTCGRKQQRGAMRFEQ
jgi:hypothetical protein